MLNKLLVFVRRYDMLQSGDTVICAVSGGADSMALLFGMYLLKDKLNVRLAAAHFNHRLRGAESDADEQFVRRFCDRFDIPLTVGSADVSPGKKGLEAAARDARYAFFATLSGKIATAHTADDNAETLIMRLVRGTGLKGLGAIAPTRGNVIRPMLSVTRQEVLSFLEEYHISYVEDSSNAGDAFLRNRLRHGVMPLLKEENPRIAENLSALALRLREDEQLLGEEVDFSHGLAVEFAQALPPARRSRVIGSFLEYCGVKEPESAHIAQTERLCSSANPSARVCLPGGVTVCRSYDRLIPMDAAQPLAATELACPGVTELPELGLQVVCAPAQTICQNANSITVCPAGKLFVRSRQSGDAMRLRGGSRSLKKLFIDRKIPAHLRNRVPVLADDAGVLGVYGIGVDLDRAAQSLPAVQITFVDTKNQ